MLTLGKGGRGHLQSCSSQEWGQREAALTAPKFKDLHTELRFR